MLKTRRHHAQHSAIADRVFGFAGAVIWMNRGYRSPAAQRLAIACCPWQQPTPKKESNEAATI
jgi:hypothetical protein